MAFIFYNPNPSRNCVRDCMIRALCKVEGMSWIDAYFLLCNAGASIYDMPDSNKVYRACLLGLGYKRYELPNTCPMCYTIKDFCLDHPYGKYIACTGEHVVPVCNGNYYDILDSGQEVPIYFYTKE